MAVTLERVDHAQFMFLRPEAPIANRVFWFTGTAVFRFVASDSDDWKRDVLYVSMLQTEGAPGLRAHEWLDGVATAALASISSRDGAGFAVDWAEPHRPAGDPPDYGVTIALAVRASDEARLYRASYSLTVIARLDSP